MPFERRRGWTCQMRRERGQGLFELAATKQPNPKRGLTWNNSMSCSDGRWCTRADALLRFEGIHVYAVTAPPQAWFCSSRPVNDLAGCPDCGVVAVGHGRRQVRLHDIPCFGRPVRLLWAKRLWRCTDPDCPRTTFTEEHPLGTAAETDRPRGGMGDRCAAAFRHLCLCPGPPARRLLAHGLGHHEG